MRWNFNRRSRWLFAGGGVRGNRADVREDGRWSLHDVPRDNLDGLEHDGNVPEQAVQVDWWSTQSATWVAAVAHFDPHLSHGSNLSNPKLLYLYHEQLKR